MIQEEANQKKHPLLDKSELLKITGMLHDTIEMELIQHQMLYESAPMWKIGLLELDDQDEDNSNDTDSEKDKEKESPIDWNVLGAEIEARAAEILKSGSKLPITFRYSAAVGRKVQEVLAVTLGTLASEPNGSEAEHLRQLHQKQFHLGEQACLLRVYEAAVLLQRVEHLLNPTMLSSALESWKLQASEAARGTPFNQLYLTCEGRLAVFEYPQTKQKPYNGPPVVNPVYTLEEVWQYIDIVEDRRELSGLRFLKERKVQPERLRLFYDWNHRVFQLDVVKKEVPEGLEEADCPLAVDKLTYYKIETHSNKFESVAESLAFLVVLSKVDELNLGPTLSHRYEVGLADELKPFYFYSSQETPKLGSLKEADKSVQHLENILVQLIKAISALHGEFISNIDLSLQTIGYDPETKQLKLSGLTQAKVLRHTYPYEAIVGVQDEVDYLTKLQENECSQYAKDISQLNDVIRLLLSDFKVQLSADTCQEFESYQSRDAQLAERGQHSQRVTLFHNFADLITQRSGIPQSVKSVSIPQVNNEDSPVVLPDVMAGAQQPIPDNNSDNPGI